MKSSYTARWGHPRYRTEKGDTRVKQQRSKQVWVYPIFEKAFVPLAGPASVGPEHIVGAVPIKL